MVACETIRVIRIGSDKKTTINKDDFDSSIHKLEGETKAPAKRKARKSKAEKDSK